ncbi:hypothetical protein T12_1340 [Trichinella patagoniensis]|uniref:Uncharacterized protein n=1 Tax=Trichinella patagoniensis TaxID=990121 RepID=A0A0V0ZMX6_9BILA|nr:hypothetical protein T12_1340 [Trichinella patagoniensis]
MKITNDVKLLAFYMRYLPVSRETIIPFFSETTENYKSNYKRNAQAIPCQLKKPRFLEKFDEVAGLSIWNFQKKKTGILHEMKEFIVPVFLRTSQGIPQN